MHAGSEFTSQEFTIPGVERDGVIRDHSLDPHRCQGQRLLAIELLCGRQQGRVGQGREPGGRRRGFGCKTRGGRIASRDTDVRVEHGLSRGT